MIGQCARMKEPRRLGVLLQMTGQSNGLPDITINK